MTEKPPLFWPQRERATSNRLAPTSVFPTPARGDVSSPAFGKRSKPEDENTSLQEKRLSNLHAELVVLLRDGALPNEPLPFKLEIDRDPPRILIQGRATVTIDEEIGCFVFVENPVFDGIVVVTTNQERLIDHVVSYLAANKNRSHTEVMNQAASGLVGQSLSDVERLVVLQTLRFYRGNRAHVANTLGIPLTALRKMLRGYWQCPEQEGGEV